VYAEMGRAPCCDKATVKKGPWAPEEDAALKAYVDAHGTGGNWIALPHKIGTCRARRRRLEMTVLMSIWLIAHRPELVVVVYAGLNRCGKSCRLRWLNYLRPNIRHGGFTEDEDRLICSLYIAIGSRYVYSGPDEHLSISNHCDDLLDRSWPKAKLIDR
jgi:myb proto-oncogene protein